MSRMDAFRDFVSRYPKVRDEVKSGNKTWQAIYEDWVILGEDNEMWQTYKENQTKENNPLKGITKDMKLEDLLSSENIKNIWGYIKKINPDNVSKTLNTVQKVLQIAQSFGGKATTGLYNANYNSWWD